VSEPYRIFYPIPRRAEMVGRQQSGWWRLRLKNCGNLTWCVMISVLRGSDMNAGARIDGGLSAVPLLNAVFCAGCETISNSPHDVCSVCGSRSLLNLFRMLDGTLRGHMPQSAKDHGKTAKYNMELTVKVHEIPANELNRTIESISRLAEVCGDLESLHINVESVFDNTQAVFRVA
jgi:hypothetical protein